MYKIEQLTMNGIKQNVLGTRAYLEGLHVSFDDMFAQGNKVASRIVITGNRTKNGQRVRIDELMIHEIIECKIKRCWSIGSEHKEV